MDVLFIAKWTDNITALVGSAYAYISDSSFPKFREPFPGPFSSLPTSDPCSWLIAASEIEKRVDQKSPSPKVLSGRETRQKSI